MTVKCIYFVFVCFFFSSNQHQPCSKPDYWCSCGLCVVPDKAVRKHYCLIRCQLSNVSKAQRLESLFWTWTCLVHHCGISCLRDNKLPLMFPTRSPSFKSKLTSLSCVVTFFWVVMHREKLSGWFVLMLMFNVTDDSEKVWIHL